MILAAAPLHAASYPGQNGRIAFVSNRNGNREIYSIHADGSGQANLTNNPANDIDSSFSPNGKQLAFASDRSGSYQIYVMNADGTGLVRLTTSIEQDRMPSYSPDGERIAFSSNRSGSYQIYVMNSDGSNQTRLTDHAADDYNPRFSPAGDRIAFVSNLDGRYEIYSMNVDGSGQTNLTNNPANDVDPSFSPSGQQLAFASHRSGSYQIYLMNIDGSGQTQLTHNLSADRMPSFSPDGGQFAFTSQRDGHVEIYTMNADASGQTRLTIRDATTYWNNWPSWEAPHTLNLAVTAVGSGKVDASSGAIAGCRAAAGTCTGTYDEAATVTLTATPDIHNAFIGWSGADVGSCDQSGARLTCPLTIPNHDATINAAFAITHALTVAAIGSGKVDASSGAITDCRTAAGTCTGRYNEATMVTLTATPDIHNTFNGWSGGGCSGAPTCTVTMSADQSIMASFLPSSDPPPPLPPTTTIAAHPKAKVKAHGKTAKVSFRFRSDQADSTYNCKLDKRPLSPCTSPKTYKVKPGKHVFRVEATNSFGQTGAPVSFRFTIVRKGRESNSFNSKRARIRTSLASVKRREFGQAPQLFRGANALDSGRNFFYLREF